jgi:hypothetical protein
MGAWQAEGEAGGPARLAAPSPIRAVHAQAPCR